LERQLDRAGHKGLDYDFRAMVRLVVRVTVDKAIGYAA